MAYGAVARRRRRAARDSSYLRGLWLFLRTWVMLLKLNPHECESVQALTPTPYR